jgi:hypothetical protein
MFGMGKSQWVIPRDIGYEADHTVTTLLNAWRRLFMFSFPSTFMMKGSCVELVFRWLARETPVQPISSKINYLA